MANTKVKVKSWKLNGAWFNLVTDDNKEVGVKSDQAKLKAVIEANPTGIFELSCNLTDKGGKFYAWDIKEGGNSFGGVGKSFAKNYKADFISFAASYSKDLIVAGKSELKDFRKVFSTMYDAMADKLDEVNAKAGSTNGTEQK